MPIFSINLANDMKVNAGDEYRRKAIRRAIQYVGDYEQFVRVWPDRTTGKTIFNYRIHETLPQSTIDKLRASIEIEAGRLNFDVCMVT